VNTAVETVNTYARHGIDLGIDKITFTAQMCIRGLKHLNSWVGVQHQRDAGKVARLLHYRM